MKQYEYKTVMLKAKVTPHEATEELNAIGADGWQLILFITAPNAPEVRAWFMREKE